MAEQLMIESLAEHGVVAEDLVPALMTTHTVKNPEYDPKAAKDTEVESGSRGEEEWDGRSEMEAPPPYEPRTSLLNPPTEISTSTSDKAGETTPRKPSTPLPTLKTRPKPINPFGDDSDEEDGPITAKPTSGSLRPASPPPSSRSPQPRKKSTNPFGSDDEEDGLPSFASSSRRPVTSPQLPTSRTPSFDFGDDEGDIGRPASPEDIPKITSPKSRSGSTGEPKHAETVSEERVTDPERTPTKEHFKLPENSEIPERIDEDVKDDEDAEPPSLPSLPGVSTSLTTADENVVLDIRWTVVSL
jgi:hypothetical protein